MVLRGINCVNVFKIISSDKIVVILINFKIKLHYKTPPMKYFYINFKDILRLGGTLVPRPFTPQVLPAV